MIQKREHITFYEKHKTRGLCFIVYQTFVTIFKKDVFHFCLRYKHDTFEKYVQSNDISSYLIYFIFEKEIHFKFFISELMNHREQWKNLANSDNNESSIQIYLYIILYIIL